MTFLTTMWRSNYKMSWNMKIDDSDIDAKASEILLLSIPQSQMFSFSITGSWWHLWLTADLTRIQYTILGLLRTTSCPVIPHLTTSSIQHNMYKPQFIVSVLTFHKYASKNRHGWLLQAIYIYIYITQLMTKFWLTLLTTSTTNSTIRTSTSIHASVSSTSTLYV